MMKCCGFSAICTILRNCNTVSSRCGTFGAVIHWEAHGFKEDCCAPVKKGNSRDSARQDANRVRIGRYILDQCEPGEEESEAYRSKILRDEIGAFGIWTKGAMLSGVRSFIAGSPNRINVRLTSTSEIPDLAVRIASPKAGTGLENNAVVNWSSIWNCDGALVNPGDAQTATAPPFGAIMSDSARLCV